MAFNLFRKNSDDAEADRPQQPRDEQKAAARPHPEASAPRRPQTEELPTENGLPELVALMDKYGVHTVQLNQQGNEMVAVLDPSEKPERKTTVDTDSAWFDGVAKLYTEAQSSPRGPWRRVEIMVANPRGGQRAVEIEYTYPDSERQERRAYVQTVKDQPEAAQGSSAAGADAVLPEADAGREAAAADASSQAADDAEQRRESGVSETSREETAENQGELRETAALPEESEREESAASSESDVDHQPSGQPIPSVIDEPEWHEGADARTLRSEAPMPSESLPESAPSIADHADVAPSYAGVSSEDQRPSSSRLAPGNLVLTEAEVLQRLTEAQQALFGAEGTARDVSTVLIRVRALGSYYDALTHVRRNGFWDQRTTFDLVPEQLLHIHELKADSYQEGEGAPVAMMFRFTPGIPPQVSFSYEDEEAFVKYKDRLPAQQYIEELRMFPRTGANIPDHMNDALTQWTL